MRFRPPLPLLFALLGPLLPAFGQDADDLLKPAFDRVEIAPLPASLEGFAIGRTGGATLIAGGTGADGGAQSTIRRYDPELNRWLEVGRLPKALARPGYTSTAEGIVLIEDSLTSPSAVFRISLDGGQAHVTELASLPFPVTDPVATVGPNALYLAATKVGAEGVREPVFLKLAVAPSLSFLQKILSGVGFDFSKIDRAWRELPIWSEAIIREASLTYSFDSVHLFGLAETTGQAVGFGYRTTGTWRTLTPPPYTRPLLGATELGESHIFALASDDRTEGPSRLVAYHTLTDTWIEALELPSRVDPATRIVTDGETILAVSAAAATRIQVLPPPNNYGWVDHTVVAIYLIAMVAMGAWFVRRERNTNDYFRASNSVPWWAIGMSLFATAASAISLMTMPGKSYSTNWTFFAISLYSVACLPLSLYLLAPLVRKLEIATANEYLELRFGLTARMLGSVIFMVNQVLGRMAPVIFLPSIAMSAITGIDIWIWILVIGSVTTLYTFLGGLSAVIWTDTIQGLIMLATVAGCLILILFKIDMPLNEIWGTLQSQEKLHIFDWGWDVAEPSVIMVFTGTIFITLLGIGDQNYVQRVQAAPSLGDAKKAVATQMAVAIPINLLLFGLGTALYLYYRSHPIQLNPVMKTDGVYPLFAAQHLPVGVSGLVIAALLAASMSTISSAICSVANLGVDDFYRRFKRNVQEKQALLLARVFSLLVGLCGIVGAIFLSLSDSKSVWDAALIITGLITNGTVGLFGLGLLTRRAHELGAILGLVAGMTVTIYLQAFTPVTFWLYMAFGSTVTFIVGYVLSLVIPFARKPIEGLTVYTLDQPRRRL